MIVDGPVPDGRGSAQVAFMRVPFKMETLASLPAVPPVPLSAETLASDRPLAARPLRIATLATLPADPARAFNTDTFTTGRLARPETEPWFTWPARAECNDPVTVPARPMP